MTKKYSERPNPNATIGFVAFNPFQFYVYKNVYKHVANKSEFIVDVGRKAGADFPEELLRKTVDLLHKRGINFRVLYPEDYLDERRLKNFFSNYKILVSLWQSGCVNLKCNRNKRTVHMNYGAGKELSIFATHHRRWDLYLCYSDYICNVIKLFTNAAVVGNPKFDDWFNNELDENAIADIKLKLDPSKKTVLYLPTWGDLGSMRYLADALESLINKYNLLVVPHYQTPYEEPELVEKIRCLGVMILGDDADLLPIFKLSDVVLSDNSSGIFDAILADKPVVVADFFSDKFLDVEHRKPKFYRFKSLYRPSTYSGSIEQRIKKENLVESFRKPDELESAIERALSDPPHFKETRKKIVKELFAFNDGRCGKRAANQLEQLLVVRSLPPKPVLYHVLEAEAESNKQIDGLRSGQATDIEWSLKILRIKNMPFWKKLFAIIYEVF